MSKKEDTKSVFPEFRNPSSTEGGSGNPKEAQTPTHMRGWGSLLSSRKTRCRKKSTEASLDIHPNKEKNVSPAWVGVSFPDSGSQMSTKPGTLVTGVPMNNSCRDILRKKNSKTRTENVEEAS